jgi:hypothetical protein
MTAVFDAYTSTDKSFHVIEGATHSYQDQPDQLAKTVSTTMDWLDGQNLR